MHKTLARQIEHHIKDAAALSTEVVELLEAVSVTYENFDQDRILIERSLEISSKELRGFISLLQATLDSTNEGILVVNKEGQLMNFNKRFLEIWEIPDEIMKTRESEKSIAHALTLVVDPIGLRNHIASVNNDSVGHSTYMVKLKDGRTIEIYSRPQLLDGTAVGRVWTSRDVTEHLRGQDELQTKVNALERLNKAMIDRELKMVELKKKIADLESQRHI